MSTFRKVGTVDEIPEGAHKAFSVGDRQALVCQVNGKFYAIEDVCSHAAVPLSTGTLVQKEIHCPLHGARFDVTSGKVLCPPARRNVSTTRVEIRENEIWLEDFSS